MQYDQDLKNNLLSFLAGNGAALAGVADLSDLEAAELPLGVIIARPMPKEVVCDLMTQPTPAYVAAYKANNDFLSDLVEKAVDYLEQAGYEAIPHTSRTVKVPGPGFAPLPHKTVATRAGLGWIGKCCLLITPEYGPSVQLSYLVTNAPLEPDEPILKSKCGKCTKCVDRCPAHAIKGTLWEPGMTRDQILDAYACDDIHTGYMKNLTGLEECGLCLAACPYTQRRLKREGVAL